MSLAVMINLLKEKQMRKELFFASLVALILAAASNLALADTHYVKAGATGNGSFWANASGDLHAMINASAVGDEVWVAANTYKPTTGADQRISFSMKNGVAIYGGFAGSLRQAIANTDPMYASADFTLNDIEYFINIPFVLQIDNIKDQYGNPYVPNEIMYQMDAGSGIFFNLPIGVSPYSIIYNYPNLGNYTIKVYIDGVEAYSNTIEVTYIPIFYSADFAVSPPSAIIGTPVMATISNIKDQFNNPYTPGSVIADVFLNNILTASATPAGSGAGPYNFVYNNLALGNYEVKFYVNGIFYETKNFSIVCPTASTLYVNAANSNSGDGTDWSKAFNKLQDALTLACNCNNVSEIWVAAGTYKPDQGVGYTTGNRNHSFVMKNGVAIYGGFPGVPGQEGNFNVRNWATYETILSGDLLGDDGANFSNRSDNSHHVINNDNNGLDNSSVLDGFTVTGGQTLCCSSNDGGGGMRNSSSSPSVTNCIFTSNYAYFGGGILNQNCSAKVTNCKFIGNKAEQNGGGLNNWTNNNGTNNAVVSNCLFLNNEGGTGSGVGGMMNINYSGTCSPNIANCTFYGNTGVGGAAGGVRNNASTPVIANCIIWGNLDGITNTNGATPTVSYSIVQQTSGVYPGTGNLNADPLFVNAAAGNLRLQACSPAINTGSNAAVPSGVTTDLDGNPRFYNSGTVDMGAYEFQGEPTPVVAACQGQTVNLNSMGAATLDASALDNGSTGCGTLTFTVGGQPSLSFTCADIGSPQYTLTVTDARGQSATCTATVTG